MLYVVYAVGIVLFIKKIVCKESIIGFCICTIVLLPSIEGIEAINFIYIMATLAALKTVVKDKVMVIEKKTAVFLLGYLIIVIIQFLSWLLKNPQNLSLELRSSFSIIRIPLLIFNLMIYEQSINKIFELSKALVSIEVINIINVVACITQKLQPYRAINLFGNWYDYSSFHISELSRNGKYYRTYGTFESPMSLGIYSVIAITILIYILQNDKRKKRIIIDILASITLGVLSLTKSFFIGIVLVIIYELISVGKNSVKNGVIDKRKIIGFYGILIGIILLIEGFFKIYNWSQQGWPHLHYYLGYIINPLSAFSSRLSASGTLASTMNIIEENIIIGIGLVPFRSELIGDNAYVVLLHAGGIIALSVFLVIYGNWIYACIVQNNSAVLLIVLMYLLFGFSLPVGLYNKVGFLPCAVFLLIGSDGGLNYEKNYNDSKTLGCRGN